MVQVKRLAVTIEWQSDSGSCYLPGETRTSRARDIGLEPRATPIESAQSNGMAEAFVRTIKRDNVRISPCPDANTTVMHQLSARINYNNEVYPHEALGYRSSREFIAPIVRELQQSSLVSRHQ